MLFLNISHKNLSVSIEILFRNPELLDECEIDEKTKEVLIENIKRRLTPQSVKIRAGEFEVLKLTNQGSSSLIVVIQLWVTLLIHSANLG